MSSLPYFVSPELEAIFVRETASIARYDSSTAPKLQDCSDKELASIRLVLRKLTALRIQNEQDAEDLVQETLLTMTAKYPECDLKKGLLIWSMGILRKKVGNYYRKARRYTTLENRPLEAERGWRRDWTLHSPESRLRHAELRMLIEHIVAEFPLPERRALELCLAGLETHEIAQRLQPERYQNVLNRLFRGRRRLARELSKYGYVHRIAGPA
jgi:RNA polymerase sigma factor (sigma-70 family)